MDVRPATWRIPLIASLALLAAPGGADVLLTVSLQPTFFARLDDRVTVSVTVLDAQGAAQPLEDVTLTRLGAGQTMAGMTGPDGRAEFTIAHDQADAVSYEYTVRCRGVEQRVTVPVGAPPQPPPDPAESALAFLLASPGAEPPDAALADPALLTAIREGLSEIAEELRADGAFLVILRGPANAAVVDEQGRRAGTVAGETVCEIPGAEAVLVGGAQWRRLPAHGSYQLTIEGTDADFGTLTLLSPHPAGLAIRVFEDLPLDLGARISVPIIQSTAQAVLTAAGLIAPAVSGLIDLSSPAWAGRSEAPYIPPADLPPEMRPLPLAADSVIERAVLCTGEDEEGRLVGIGADFPVGTRQVGLHLMVRNAPPGTELHLTWMHEGNVLRRQPIAAGGTGALLTYLLAADRPDLWPGNYAVIIRQNDRHIATLNFAVR